MAAKGQDSFTFEQLNRDMEAFFEFCKENRLTDEEIENICQPLIKIINRARFLRYLKAFALVMFFILMLYVICCSETVSWHSSAIGRIAMIKMLPLYDWTHLKNEKCLISKNNVEKYEPTFECVLCETVTDIRIAHEINPEELYNYINIHVPVGITNVLQEWKIVNQPFANLTELLVSNKVLSTSFPCKLSSNIHRGEDTLKNILTKTRSFENFFLHFQNCEFDAVKNFRILAPRPGFLHKQISPIQYSWILFNRNYNVTKYKRIDLQERITIVGQILGSTFLRLIPQNECELDCFPLEIELNMGQALVFTSLWNLEYKPNPQGENAAVILEAH